MNINLNAIKDNIIDNVLDDVLAGAKSVTERNILKEELKAKIKNNVLITNIPQDDIFINANNINGIMNKLYIDLLTTYGVLNTMCENLTKYNVNYTTYIEYINSRINAITDSFEACRHSLTSIYMPSFYIEKFRSADSFDTTRSLQRTRYDGWFPSHCICNYDSEQNHITLPLLRQDNSLKYDDKVETGYISATFQLGKGFVGLNNKETVIENCLSSNKGSFWSISVMSDAKLKVDFEEKKPDKLYVNDGYFYDISNGAVCELEINFESVNTVNEIVLSPCVNYPIRLVAIRYKQTDDEDEPLKEIVYPDNDVEALRDVFSKNKFSFKFPDILCKKIYILFTQEHYIRKTYVYNPQEIYKNTLWFDSKNNVSSKVLEAEFQPLYHDRAENSTSWNNVNNKILEGDNKDLANIILGDVSQNRKVIKYEYQYGFYNIGCFNNHYDKAGIYVSKLIDMKNNIKTINIYTDEIHQTDSLDHYVTDIEYYISGSKNPTSKDWYPILPKGVKTIKSEILEITGGTYAYLRFYTQNVRSIMKNGEPIDINSNDINLIRRVDNSGASKYIWAVQIVNYDYDAVYSISYDPIEGADEVNFSDKISTSIESFEGNNKTFFELGDEPYIDAGSDYCNVKLTNVNKDTNGEEIQVENVTEESDQSIGYKNFTNNGHYQFYVYKNKIYFNKEVPKNYIVDVSYKHLITKFRTKAIFRRNSTKDGWLTPILNSIEYEIETF